MKVKNDLRTRKIALNALTVVFTVISLVYVFPVLMVLLNSFKGNTFVKTDTGSDFKNKALLRIGSVVRYILGDYSVDKKVLAVSLFGCAAVFFKESAYNGQITEFHDSLRMVNYLMISTV